MRDSKGRFLKGNKVSHAGRKKYHYNCQWCGAQNSSSDKRNKYCNRTCFGKHIAFKKYGKFKYFKHYLRKFIKGKVRQIHQLVWMKHNNMCYVPRGCVIHHIDLNKKTISQTTCYFCQQTSMFNYTINLEP